MSARKLVLTVGSNKDPVFLIERQCNILIIPSARRENVLDDPRGILPSKGTILSSTAPVSGVFSTSVRYCAVLARFGPTS